MITTLGKTVEQVMQEIADKLFEQGKPCQYVDEGGERDFCIYDDGCGNHCAVGWLLPQNDELYTLEANVDGLIASHPDLLGENASFIIEHCEILTKLQKVHDNTENCLLEGCMKRFEYSYMFQPFIDKCVDKLL